MSGPPPAVAATRLAVRRVLHRLGPGARVGVAVSGGADSLALVAAAADEAGGAGAIVSALVVDHQLQPGSDRVAARAATQCTTLGVADVEVRWVEVDRDGPNGPEAAARTARYAALREWATDHRLAAVLLGHTEDDQAEQVLLGLLRGSGARSLSGMAPQRGLVLRPFLALPRSVTRQACRERGLTWWDDPHNDDPVFRRTQARRVLALLGEALGASVTANLARSADLLRADADLLDELAGTAQAALPGPPYRVTELAALPDALRGRVWRRLAIGWGCPAGALTARHVEALDALVGDWHGQGPVWLPGGRSVRRVGDRIEP